MFARLRTYASFVRFSHSVFALPFALAGALLASRVVAFSWSSIGWIILCMVSARSAAMGFNRFVDAEYDGRNPRTAMRELPRGVLTRPEAAAFIVVASMVFVAGAAMLGRWPLVLSPLALAIVFWYSLAKRVSSYTQLFLGLAMAVAPVGGWIAMGADPFAAEPWGLGVAIGSWVAGFDVLYACQDLEFDRREGLRSIPVRYGVERSLWISRALHAATVFALTAVGVVAGLGSIYYAGVALVAALLAFEQSLVKVDDLSQVKRAFDLNAWVGLLYFAAMLLDVWAA
jgi:4-hydroxybenzoate polyprenyltransferase